MGGPPRVSSLVDVLAAGESSSYIRAAARRYGISRKLTTEPNGPCLDGALSQSFDERMRLVDRLVAGVEGATISTRPITGTGEKKSIRRTRSELCTALASSAIGIDEVFVAMTRLSPTMPASVFMIASSVRRSRARLDHEFGAARRPPVRSSASFARAPSRGPRRRLAAFDPCGPTSSPAAAGRVKILRQLADHDGDPATAAVSAIPAPMKPPPTTASADRLASSSAGGCLSDSSARGRRRGDRDPAVDLGRRDHRASPADGSTMPSSARCAGP